MTEEKNGLQPKKGFVLGIVIGIAVVGILSLIGAFVLIATSGEADITVAGESVVQGSNIVAKNNDPLAGVAAASSFQEKVDAQICKEDGKPVVYLFSTTGCPHCKWVKPAFDEIADKYVKEGKIVAYHWELDTGDDTLTSTVETATDPNHEAIYTQFNPEGTVPTFVFGCKYYRIGTAHEQDSFGLDGEKAEFEALIQELIK
ncbi:MAG: thioredoxin domain-containing protein [Patescibacteria group bacterium]|jgi:thiol-disulfide isomerase/thioredoxin